MQQNEQARGVWIERLLIGAGVLGLLVCLLAYSKGISARRAAAQIVPVSASVAAPATQNTSSETASGGDSPAIVGRVEIPAIGMITPLLAGDDSMSLTEGAGHIPGTAFPGGLGTVGIAGHRDTHFKLLRKAKAGMDVRIVGKTGVYHYRVTSSEIVTPEQVSVLDIVSEPGLVLITCYPFHYIGTAPKRFVVHAALISAAPDDL